MALLTIAERLSFTAGQLAELDRVADLAWLLVLDTSSLQKQQVGVDQNGVPIMESDGEFDARKAAVSATHRAKVVGRLANSTPAQIKARLNIITFSGNTPTYSSDNNYSVAERLAITLGYKGNRGRPWGTEVPAILAHDSEMAADGLSPAIRKAVLRAR